MDGVSQVGFGQQGSHQLLYVLGIGIYRYPDTLYFVCYPIEPVVGLLLDLLQDLCQRFVGGFDLLCDGLSADAQQEANDGCYLLSHTFFILSRFHNVRPAFASPFRSSSQTSVAAVCSSCSAFPYGS
jgi:hypothetical protein